MAREFFDAPAVRKQVPLIIGLTGPSWSGKTWTGLRLATGIQRVVGGDIFGIDTESNRMLHYSEFFKFRHLSFAPPHGPLDYIGAIDHCVGKKARVILIDSMSHEHSGTGGVLDRIEKYLDEKCGDDWAKRLRNNQAANVRVKAERKKLNLHINELAKNVVFILCYRAAEKLAWKAGEEPKKLGWQADTTSILPYDMVVRFLLPAGAGGVPDLKPATPAEALNCKMPHQFKEWFKPGDALNETAGERLAQWAMGAKDELPESDGMGALYDVNEKAETMARDWISAADEVTTKNEYLALKKRLAAAGIEESVRAFIRGPLETAKLRVGA